LPAAKLGIPNPTIKITEHKTQEHQSFSYRLDILESTFMDKIGTLQEDMNHKFEITNMLVSSSIVILALQAAS
jgi:hypothetical protein